MARITSQNIDTVDVGTIIYKFPASQDKPQDDFSNADFYYLKETLRKRMGELSEFILLVVVPPIVPRPKILNMQTSKLYNQLIDGTWYTYEIKFTEHHV